MGVILDIEMSQIRYIVRSMELMLLKPANSVTRNELPETSRALS